MTQQMHILVVDDNKVNQILIVAYLVKFGHRVDVAHNGHEAIAAVKSNDYALVLMDIQMPILDGIEATKQIRLLPEPKRFVPIIATTADTTGEHVRQFGNFGFNNLLPKPINFGDLCLLIECYNIVLGDARN